MGTMNDECIIILNASRESGRQIKAASNWKFQVADISYEGTSFLVNAIHDDTRFSVVNLQDSRSLWVGTQK
jgi:hypothetical protein